MSVEKLIARRYLFGRRKFSFINIISLLATLGIMFGVAALIVVMSVFNGFGSLVVSILQDFDPHVKVERVRGAAGLSADSVEAIIRGLPGVKGYSPFVERKAMAMSREYTHFIWVKGVDVASLDRVSGVRSKVVLGTFRMRDASEIILGIALADKLRVLAGDTLTLISPAGMEKILTQFVVPTVSRSRVEGIFESQNKLYDGNYIFVNLKAAQEFFRMGNAVTGYELRFGDIDESDRVGTQLQARLGKGWRVLTWYDLHKDLYSVMTIERWSAFVLLCVIIAVAVFNILASLTMLVLEKKRDIGILRTMGMTEKSVQRVFMLDGLWIGIMGVVGGLVAGLGICWLQAEYQLFKLDTAFIIPALPVEVRISDIAIIVTAAFVLCIAAAWYPSYRAKNVEIIDAIRWE